MPVIAFVVLTMFCGWLVLVGLGNIRGTRKGNVLDAEGELWEILLPKKVQIVKQGGLGVLLIVAGIAGFVWITVETF